jgi:hypothetical protein
MGRGAGDFMSDIDMFYPKVITLTDRMRPLLKDRIHLPDDAYVFANRYGEQIFLVTAHPNFRRSCGLAQFL